MELNDWICMKNSEDLASDVIGKVKSFNGMATGNGFFYKCYRNYRLYYNADPNGIYSAINSSYADFGVSGDSGEYLSMKENHMRNILQHMMTMIFASLPVPKARVANSSSGAMRSIEITNQLLENLFSKNAGQATKSLKKAVELALVLSTGFIVLEWDDEAGDEYIEDVSGRKIYTGDVSFRPYDITNVIFNTIHTRFEDLDWVILIQIENKFKLAAKFPDLADKIINTSFNIDGAFGFERNQKLTDEVIYTYKFFAKGVNGVLPDGRYMYCAGADTVMYDGPNPYGKLPIYKITPNDGIGTLYGYTPAFDLAPLQMFINMCDTAMATTVAANAIPNIIIDPEYDFTQNNLIGGMNLIHVPNGSREPSQLKMESVDNNVLNLKNTAIMSMEQISGISSTVRGNPDSNLKSGKALAMIRGMSEEYMSCLQNSVVQTIKDTASDVIDYYRKFQSVERTINIIGKNNASNVKKWKSDTLNGVSDFYVETIDPLMQTSGGRAEVVQPLLQAGLIDPSAYLKFLTSGKIEPLIKSETSETDYIMEENEILMSGGKCKVMFLDNHQEHIKQHKTITFDNRIRMNSDNPNSIEYSILNETVRHIMEHEDELNRNKEPTNIQQQTTEQPPQ